jgi:hypothetical protein
MDDGGVARLGLAGADVDPRAGLDVAAGDHQADPAAPAGDRAGERDAGDQQDDDDEDQHAHEPTEKQRLERERPDEEEDRERHGGESRPERVREEHARSLVR